MKSFKVTYNYSAALYNACLSSRQKTPKILKELEYFANLLLKSSKLSNLLNLPTLESSVKIRLVNGIAKNLEYSKITIKFLILLIKNSRIDYLNEIIICFKKILADAENIQILNIFSSKKFNKTDKIKLEEFLKNDFKDIKLNYCIDPNLIGGFIIKYDNNLIDYSIKGSINLLLS